MKPDDIANAQLAVANLQIWVTAAAAILGPLAAFIAVTIYQPWKEKRDAQIRLFTGLLSERGGTRSYQGAAAMNTIDVVFADKPGVLKAWREYHALLMGPTTEGTKEGWNLLLRAMGTAVGFKHLDKIDFDAYYLPNWQAEANLRQVALQTETLRVLRNSEFVGSPRIEGIPPSGAEEPPSETEGSSSTE